MTKKEITEKFNRQIFNDLAKTENALKNNTVLDPNAPVLSANFRTPQTVINEVAAQTRPLSNVADKALPRIPQQEITPAVSRLGFFSRKSSASQKAPVEANENKQEINPASSKPPK